MLIAAPAFLGTLRQKLSVPLSRMVIEEVDKDYTKNSVSEIAASLTELRTGQS